MPGVRSSLTQKMRGQTTDLDHSNSSCIAQSGNLMHIGWLHRVSNCRPSFLQVLSCPQRYLWRRMQGYQFSVVVFKSCRYQKVLFQTESLCCLWDGVYLSQGDPRWFFDGRKRKVKVLRTPSKEWYPNLSRCKCSSLSQLSNPRAGRGLAWMLAVLQ